MSFGKYLSPHAREVAHAIRYAARRDVLGEHFEFVGEPEFVYGKGKLTSPVQLKFLKKEEVKDKIVLKVDPSAAQYVAGDPGEYTITIIGSDYFKIEGTWYVYQQPTDKQYFINQQVWDTAMKSLPKSRQPLRPTPSPSIRRRTC